MHASLKLVGELATCQHLYYADDGMLKTFISSSAGKTILWQIFYAEYI